MSELNLQHLKKVYEGDVVAVHDFNIDIKDGEFIVIVGPSGCGKSTSLRMIAGLEEISSGKAILDGKDITDVASKNRDMAMVFQNYALYAHMTIYQNLAFSLTLRHVDKKEIHRKVMAVAAMLNLDEQLNKKPKQLSGGQRQRVALGRALVRTPKIFLFDEPLSNLDAKLRVKMRREIKILHQKITATMIYVTHDQVEALTLADRIVVMSMGHVQQIGTPLEIYSNPNNKFVASFVGNPPMNFFYGKISADGNKFVTDDFSFDLDEKRKIMLKEYINKDVILGVRPEHFIPKGDLKAKVEIVEHLGAHTLFNCSINRTKAKIKFEGWLDYKEGDDIIFSFNQDLICFFDKRNEERIR
ncbi:MAG: ABC transporter ATP-binding protein [Bacilli bacterium]|nr:ABC transporter ATP-binding protein [Bacilli bacterium]